MRTLSEARFKLNQLYKENLECQDPEPLTINEGPDDTYRVNLKKPQNIPVLIPKDLLDTYIDQFGDQQKCEAAKAEIIGYFKKLRKS